jgi:NAD(P)-dependent dehydrogenase (short-subunit alcohol dehydrogenase family)
VAIFGASGALGGAFVNALAPLPAVATIYAGARSPPSGGTKIIPFSFDLLDEVAIAAVAAQVQAEGPLDLVIVATGQLHDGAAFQPEKTWRDWKPDAFARAFAVNATGPAIIAKHFLPLLAKDRRSVFAALSARVGSIEDNHLGGWAAYRASKAALHQIVRTAAIELARRNKAAFCVALHPGTVDSALSKPFQSGVAQNKLFSADQSASSMLAVLDGLEEGDSGCAFAWDGERIPF